MYLTRYLKHIFAVLAVFSISHAMADEASLRKALEAAYPKMHADSIVKTPYAGLYEIFIGGQLVYSDENLNFMIVEGRLIDPKNKRDISSERLQDLTKIDFSALPLEQAIKVVKGNGSRKLVVFSDPDCPFCKRLEQKELSNINDVTIYTFLFPLENLHPDAENKAKAIWCAPDKSKAWTDWVLNSQLPKTSASCDTPLDKTAILGRNLNVVSTPTLFFANGKRMLGAQPYQDIEKGLVAASAKK
jgi:thiol:disulfide interchange protein DsbC